MEKRYLLGELYDAQRRSCEKGAMSRVLYEGSWIEGFVTGVDCRNDKFEIEIPGEYTSGKLDIEKAEAVEETSRELPELAEGRPIRIWVDDLRPVPAGYEGSKSVNETIALIERIEESGGTVEVIDLDHDLGDYAEFGGDAIKILDYLVMEEKFYPVRIHTANPVGRANMERMVERFWPRE